MAEMKQEEVRWRHKASHVFVGLFLVLVLITGCDITGSSDPPGTVTSDLNTSYEYGSGNSNIDFETGNVGLSVDNTDLTLTTPLNFSARGKLVDVGEVSGVGDINSVPTAGWVSMCAPVVGDGYLVNSINVVGEYGEYELTGNIYRVYVDDYIISAISGGVIGYRIKWVLFED